MASKLSLKVTLQHAKRVERKRYLVINTQCIVCYMYGTVI